MLRSALILSLLWLCNVAAAADVAVPELRSPVTDLTQTLTSAQAATLDQRLREFEARKGSQIALLILPTTQPETLEGYGIRVAEAWQLGRKDVDDGVLLLVAKDDRAVRIEVGYGLEGALPDVIANRIIDQVIVPRFRDGDFFGGIAAGIDRIIAVIEGEPLPAEPQRSVPFESIGQALPLLLMLLFVGSGLLRRMLGSFGGATVTAGLAGVLIWILTSVVALSIVAAIIGFLFTLFGAAGVGRGWTNSRRGGGFGGGGGWRGGGGGGGWSGGGGGFGGGGASGRW